MKIQRIKQVRLSPKHYWFRCDFDNGRYVGVPSDLLLDRVELSKKALRECGQLFLVPTKARTPDGWMDYIQNKIQKDWEHDKTSR